MKRTSLLALVLVLTMVAFASACPMCKDSLPADASGAGTMQPIPFNLGIYYMLGGFFFVVGMVSTIIWKGVHDSNHHDRDGRQDDDDQPHAE